MAMRRVLAHIMHEHEAADVQARMQDYEASDAFYLGMMDEADIVRLQARGFLIEDAPVTRVARARGVGTAQGITGPGRHSAVRTRIMRTETSAVDTMASAPGEATHTTSMNCVLDLAGPLFDRWRLILLQLGVEFVEALGSQRYLVRATALQQEELKALPFVRDIRPDDGTASGSVTTFASPSTTPPSEVEGPLRARARGGLGRPDRAAAAVRAFDILVSNPDEVAAVARWLEARAIPVVGIAARKLRVRLAEPDRRLDEIASLREVLRVEEFIEPHLFLDLARSTIGLDRVSAGGVARAVPQTGRGQVIGIADTGIDVLHSDFNDLHGQSRIRTAIALGRPGDVSDPHGHGTHVASIAAGNGHGSGGVYAGVAPEAALVIQSLLDIHGKLGGLPLDLGELFLSAYQAGVRIHNNSWGSDTKATYTSSATEVDAFVAEHRDMLVVIAAGNDGAATDNRNARPGWVDWLSVGSPATAKNALTVGASRSARTAGGWSSRTYRSQWPDRFPDPPCADERISGNPESLAAFSGRGPCDDARIKPDVVAPGTDIVAARSSLATSGFWQLPADPGPPAGYAHLGGTSMAAPLVAGCAALVRQYYVEERHHTYPSAALLKATLIAGTRWLTGADAVDGHPTAPNYHQGFGAVDMRSTLPTAERPAFRLAFRDDWQNPARRLASTGRRARFRVEVQPGERLRICLTWTDPPARSLQNSLDLLVEDPSGRKYLGNDQRPRAMTATDRDNNVEVVTLETPVAGVYLIHVVALNLLFPDQDFALVASGALATDQLHDA